MGDLLAYTMFQDVLFPPESEKSGSEDGRPLCLRRIVRFSPPPGTLLMEVPIVVFDLETTGFDLQGDRIIEIGAVKYRKLQPVEEFSTLVDPGIVLPWGSGAHPITGITAEMLMGQPGMNQVLPAFLAFIEGAILVAHNADFDLSFVRAASAREGIDLEWPVFCTLKMARHFLPQLESKGLDALAVHYGFTFDARHRSMGDVKVTAGVLHRLLAEQAHGVRRWEDARTFASV